jgi:hypothetical protein
VLLKPLVNGIPLMLPDLTLPVPASLTAVLAVFAPLFTAPSFRTFCGLARASSASLPRSICASPRSCGSS